MSLKENNFHDEMQISKGKKYPYILCFRLYILLKIKFIAKEIKSKGLLLHHL